jgi:hypothetical protein
MHVKTLIQGGTFISVNTTPVIATRSPHRIEQKCLNVTRDLAFWFRRPDVIECCSRFVVGKLKVKGALSQMARMER